MKKMFKVISAVEKDGKTAFWMRLGTAFVNRDNSINVYLDACPRSMQFQIRRWTSATSASATAVPPTTPRT